MKFEESKIQQALVEWSHWKQGEHPELKLLHAIPNGGKRNAFEAMRLKREGVKAGVPDLFLPCARHGFHGLYLECKAAKGKLTPAQEEFKALLEWQLYKVEVFKSTQEGINILERWVKD